MSTLIALIPALPFVGFVVTLLLGKRLFGRQAHLLATALVTASCVLALIVFAQLFQHPEEPLEVSLFTWVTAGEFTVQWGYYVDSLTAIMLVVVGVIGMLVHYYSIGYMHGDEGYYRFFAYLNLFMFAMFVLILADNFLLLFLAWEGVGLCSYLLIAFWFRKKSASQAGKKAFLVNRVGDFGFMLGMFLIFVTTGTLQFTGVFSEAETIGSATMAWICLLLFTGAIGKSAQFPLHVWLPDAMEGPTPVSALIHAATMVNAGVYMVARAYPLFIESEAAMLVVMIVGTFTAIYAAVIAITQHDIKKVIAYSTISSLGFMFMALGSGAWVAGIFYLFAHGFFKGLLFLASGSVIHAMSGEQDMRFMGGLRKKLPVTFWTMLIGAFAMTGVLPAAGFWAKDEILAGAAIEGFWIVWGVGIVTAFLTSIYMFRLIFLTFWGENRSSAEVQAHIHESPAVMTVPLVLLAIPSALLGGLVGWPPEAGWVHTFLEPVFFDLHHEDFVWVGEGGGLMLISILVVLAGLAVAWYMYLRRPELPTRVARRAGPAYTASLRKLYMDEVYEVAPIRSTVAVSKGLWVGVDEAAIDGAVNGLARLWAWAGAGLRPLQTGRLQNYALAIFLGMVVLVVVVRWF
ncbi:MAG TPA: NADH-quinone oxidoreductase subunit L [Thermoleophilia bacterium]|nr:NADH-quinone oxidoreductase subunit L [Thermoleophilia bacterium]